MLDKDRLDLETVFLVLCKAHAEYTNYILYSRMYLWRIIPYWQYECIINIASKILSHIIIEGNTGMDSRLEEMKELELKFRNKVIEVDQI